MKKCIQCNLSYEDDKKFCKKCGRPLIAETVIGPKELAKKSVLEERIKLDPLNTDLLNEYGQFLYHNSLFQEAVAAFLKILAIDNNNPDIKELIFKSYLKLKDYKEATRIGNELLSEKPDDQFLLEELAKVTEKLGDKGKAMEHYERILTLNPSNKYALYGKAFILIEKNLLNEAAEIFNKAYQAGRDDRITIIYTGIWRALNHDFKGAIKLLLPVLSGDKLSKKDLDNSRGFLYLAYCFCQEDLLHEVKRYCQKINLSVLKTEWHSTDRETLESIIEFIINKSLPSLEQRDQIMLLTESYLQDEYFRLESNSRKAELWFAVGNRQTELKLFKDALCSFEKAVSIDPNETKHIEKRNEIKEFLGNNHRKRRKRVNRIVAISFVGVVFIILAVIIVRQVKENMDWKNAKETNTFPAYETYMNQHPQGEYIKEATLLKEEALWKLVLSENNSQTIELYIAQFPLGKYITQARTKFDQLLWEEVKKENTVESYTNYLNLPGIRIYKDEANEKRNKLAIQSIPVEKIKNDLVGKYIPHWTFVYASEIKGINIRESMISDSKMILYADMKLEDYKTKEILYASTIIEYKSNDFRIWNFEKVKACYYGSIYGRYMTGGKLFIIGKWRWPGNFAEYRSDGTWTGKWDNGKEINGLWTIVDDELRLFQGDRYDLWTKGKIRNYSNSRLEALFDNIEVAERVTE